MNCKQVEKLLPLYAGDDLDGRREHLIAAHLQTCATCAEAFAEYHDARDLMRGSATPVFSDELYADIRASVWRRIESESRPSLFAAMAAWFQPRLVWAGVAAMLVTVSVIGAYVTNQRITMRAKVIAEIVLPSQPGSSQNGGNDFSNSEKKPRPRQADVTKRQRRSDRIVAPDRSFTAKAYSPDPQVTKDEASSPIIGADNIDLGSGSVRLELQTKDPNIRIIWFTQSDAKPVTHSKGI